jgi:hypothetical protein
MHWTESYNAISKHNWNFLRSLHCFNGTWHSTADARYNEFRSIIHITKYHMFNWYQNENQNGRIILLNCYSIFRAGETTCCISAGSSRWPLILLWGIDFTCHKTCKKLFYTACVSSPWTGFVQTIKNTIYSFTKTVLIKATSWNNIFQCNHFTLSSISMTSDRHKATSIFNNDITWFLESRPIYSIIWKHMLHIVVVIHLFST